MSGFIEGVNRYQSTLFPERVDDYADEDSVVRAPKAVSKSGATGHPLVAIKFWASPFGQLDRLDPGRFNLSSAPPIVPWVNIKLARYFSSYTLG
ncbi:MAG: hypothetical protein HKN34_09440 [Gammaproteobacteria bacterium]|nr:hypothetical protein [Gammaproteobacteria bacterium]